MYSTRYEAGDQKLNQLSLAGIYLDCYSTIKSGFGIRRSQLEVVHGVWNQAAKGAPRQQDILQALAEYPEGREKEELQQELGIDNQDLDRAITTLKHHDVIGEDGTKIKILVELFRRWLVRS